jgi:hypothetical protein
MLQLPSIASPLGSPPASDGHKLGVRVVGREQMCRYPNPRDGLKNQTSNALNIKGGKAAAQRDYVDMLVLRKQLKAIPDTMREEARVAFVLGKERRAKDLQDHQCAMVCRLGKAIAEQFEEYGTSLRKFQVRQRSSNLILISSHSQAFPIKPPLMYFHTLFPI